jgi:hypothetical protein
MLLRRKLPGDASSMFDSGGRAKGRCGELDVMVLEENVREWLAPAIVTEEAICGVRGL